MFHPAQRHQKGVLSCTEAVRSPAARQDREGLKDVWRALTAFFVKSRGIRICSFDSGIPGAPGALSVKPESSFNTWELRGTRARSVAEHGQHCRPSGLHMEPEGGVE